MHQSSCGSRGPNPQRDDDHQLPTPRQRDRHPRVDGPSTVHDDHSRPAAQGVQHLADGRGARLEVAVCRPAQQREPVRARKGIEQHSFVDPTADAGELIPPGTVGTLGPQHQVDAT